MNPLRAAEIHPTMLFMLRISRFLSTMETRYQRLERSDMERVRVLAFGVFFSASTAIAMLAGIESAYTIGPIAGAIAGIELGGMIATGMKSLADRFRS